MRSPTLPILAVVTLVARAGDAPSMPAPLGLMLPEVRQYTGDHVLYAATSRGGMVEISRWREPSAAPRFFDLTVAPREATNHYVLRVMDGLDTVTRTLQWDATNRPFVLLQADPLMFTPTEPSGL